MFGRRNKQEYDFEKNNLFLGIDLKEINFHFNNKDIFSIKEGDIVYKQKDPADTIFLVLSGEIKIKFTTERGAVISKYTENDFFGEKELLAKTARNSSAVADTKATLYPVSRTDLASYLSKNSNILTNLQRQAIEDSKNKIISTNDLAKYLIDDLSSKSEEPEIIPEPEPKKTPEEIENELNNIILEGDDIHLDIDDLNLEHITLNPDDELQGKDFFAKNIDFNNTEDALNKINDYLDENPYSIKEEKENLDSPIENAENFSDELVDDKSEINIPDLNIENDYSNFEFASPVDEDEEPKNEISDLAESEETKPEQQDDFSFSFKASETSTDFTNEFTSLEEPKEDDFFTNEVKSDEDFPFLEDEIQNDLTIDEDLSIESPSEQTQPDGFSFNFKENEGDEELKDEIELPDYLKELEDEINSESFEVTDSFEDKVEDLDPKIEPIEDINLDKPDEETDYSSYFSFNEEGLIEESKDETQEEEKVDALESLEKETENLDLTNLTETDGDFNSTDDLSKYLEELKNLENTPLEEEYLPETISNSEEIVPQEEPDVVPIPEPIVPEHEPVSPPEEEPVVPEEEPLSPDDINIINELKDDELELLNELRNLNSPIEEIEPFIEDQQFPSEEPSNIPPEQEPITPEQEPTAPPEEQPIVPEKEPGTIPEGNFKHLNDLEDEELRLLNELKNLKDSLDSNTEMEQSSEFFNFLNDDEFKRIDSFQLDNKYLDEDEEFAEEYSDDYSYENDESESTFELRKPPVSPDLEKELAFYNKLEVGEEEVKDDIIDEVSDEEISLINYNKREELILYSDMEISAFLIENSATPLEIIKEATEKLNNGSEDKDQLSLLIKNQISLLQVDFNIIKSYGLGTLSYKKEIMDLVPVLSKSLDILAGVSLTRNIKIYKKVEPVEALLQIDEDHILFSLYQFIKFISEKGSGNSLYLRFFENENFVLELLIPGLELNMTKEEIFKQNVGLAICNDLFLNHNIELEVFDYPGQGTKINFVFNRY